MNYNRAMNRFLLLMAMLFGLAAVPGPAMASVAASGQFWTIASQELCVEAEASQRSAPAFKRCSKKINGHVISCQQAIDVLVFVHECCLYAQAAVFAAAQDSAITALGDDGRFRPPRTAYERRRQRPLQIPQF